LLRPLVPRELEIDEAEGTSWVGVVPFRMEGVTPRFVPALPWVSTFPELNLRLNVSDGDKPGVWFLSLDATNPLAVIAAQTLFHLPYYWASMSFREEQGEIHYASQRRGGFSGERRGEDLAPAFEASYAPAGEVYRARTGTLEHWLTERYCLYARSRSGRLYRGEVHHEPWHLQPAGAEIRLNTLGVGHGLDLSGAPALLHFSRSIDVALWSLERVA
jgi:uncharacterized protein YqjF (DUF2071 family)